MHQIRFQIRLSICLFVCLCIIWSLTRHCSLLVLRNTTHFRFKFIATLFNTAEIGRVSRQRISFVSYSIAESWDGLYLLIFVETTQDNTDRA